MRNLLNILSILLGVMVSITSCHREDAPYDDTVQDENGSPISFSHINASLETRADEATGTTTPPIESFKVWASRTYGSGNSEQTNYSIFRGDVVDYDSDNSSWEYSPVRYWQSGTYDFIAVSQYPDGTAGTLSADGLSLTFGTNGWDLTASPQDLLLAAAPDVSGDARFNKTAPSAVDLAFNHQLALVKFSAMNVETDEEVSITVTDIEISGHNTVATKLEPNKNPVWTFTQATAGGQSLSPETGTSISTEGYTEIPADILVFPQTCESLFLELTFNDTHNGVTTIGNIKTATISTAWETGKQYEYKINVGFDAIRIGAITVTDWVNGGAIEPDEDEF